MANFMAKQPGDAALRTGGSVRLFASLGGCPAAHDGTGHSRSTGSLKRERLMLGFRRVPSTSPKLRGV